LCIFVLIFFLFPPNLSCCSRLTQSNQQISEQLGEAQTQSRLGESEVVPLRFQVQRLKTEVDSTSRHSTWLEGELKSKNERLAAVRAEQAAEMAQIRSDLDQAITAKETAEGDVITLRQQTETLDTKVERLSRELLQTRKDASDSKLEFEEELVAERRLVSMQQEQLERLKQRHDRVVQDMESLQNMAAQAQEESRDELEERKLEVEIECKKIVQEQANAHKKVVEDLKQRLEDANRRRTQAEDGLLMIQTPASPRQGRQSLPAITAGGDASMETDDEPLNLTDMYTRWQEAEDHLKLEKTKRMQKDLLVERIRLEMEAKAPLLLRQKAEFEAALEQKEEYESRWKAALSETKSCRDELNDVQFELSAMARKKLEAQEEAKELAKQVQALLVSKNSGGSEVSVPDIPTSIKEMQNQNQRLLQEHRRVTARIAELEEKDKSDVWRQRAEESERELAGIQEDRKTQLVMVESIVQQRDLYRTLLMKHDTNLLGQESEEISALQIVKKQSERARTLEDRCMRLENDLNAARAELGTVGRDKETAAERLARYEILKQELTISVDKLQVELSSGKAEVARRQAEATFLREKCARLEETLERSRADLARATESKNELNRINAQLQKTVSVDNAEISRLESDLRQVRRMICDSPRIFCHRTPLSQVSPSFSALCVSCRPR
jgi:nucleoprotein TPR